MMFTPDEMTLLVACMKRYGVAELEIRQDSEELRLVYAAGTRPAATHAAHLSGQTIFATAFGTLHLEREVGDAVEAGDIIATVATGPLRRPVVSPVAGRLAKSVSRQDQRVGYGMPLFEILEGKELS